MFRSGSIELRCIVLGWTGVLLDDQEAISRSHAATIERLGGHSPTLPERFEQITGKWEHSYHKVGVSLAHIKRSPGIFTQEYERFAESAVPYPDTVDALETLVQQGFVLVVFSDLPREALLHSLMKYNLLKYFSHILALEDLTCLGAEFVRDLLRTLKLQPAETLMIDSNRENIKLGLEAGMITAGIGPDNENLKNADFRISNLASLTKLLDGFTLITLPVRDVTTATLEYRQHIDERYYKKLNGTLPRIQSFYHAENLAFCRMLMDWKIVPARSWITDIGSGTSIASQWLAQCCPGGKVLDVDISFPALVQSRLSHEDMDKSAKWLPINSDAARLPFADSSIDLIICTEVLEHVINDLVILEEMSRVLKPEGFLIISVPNNIKRTLPLFRNLLRKFNLNGHIREYTPEEVTELLQVNQLEPIRIQGTSFFIFWMLFSVERSDLSGWIGAFIKGRPRLGNCLEKIFAHLMNWENRSIGHWAGFGIRNLFLAQKNTSGKRS